MKDYLGLNKSGINMDLTEWIEEVRQLLYEIAHQENDLGVRAECLGSFIPDLLENIMTHNREEEIAMVKELREITGRDMMSCTKALTQSGWDIKKATQWFNDTAILSTGIGLI